MTFAPPAFAAVVLAGGAARRLSGADKALLEVGGRSLLDRALAAVDAATQTVVVGPRRPVVRDGPAPAWTREQPEGGGPAAALLAGVAALSGAQSLVVVLAVDMPFASADTVGRLVEAARAHPGADGAVLIDDGGRRQPLCAAYRTDALLDRGRTFDAHGLAVGRLVAGLALVDVPGVGDEARDVDTWADLRGLGGTVA